MAKGTSVKIEHLAPLPSPAEALAKEGALPAEALANASALTTEFTLQGGLDPYQGPWTKAEAAHLLRRTTFGLKQAHLDQCSRSEMRRQQ